MADEAPAEATEAAADAPATGPSGIKKFLTSPIFAVVMAVVGGGLGAGVMLFMGKGKPPAVEEKVGAEKPGAKKAAAGHESPNSAGEAKEELSAAPEVNKSGEEAKAAGEGGATADAAEAGGEENEALKFKFEPFVINVFEKNSIHYLKLQVEVLTTDPKVAEEIKAKQPQFRDAAIFLVGDMSMREIVTTGGKMLLKEELTSTFNKMIKSGQITKMYFTEFTIQ